MLVRRLAALIPVALVLFLGVGVLSPATVAATDPVTNLSVTQAQQAGHNDTWSVTATWDDNGAGVYTASIVPNADGSGPAYAMADVSTNTATLTTNGLLDGQTYYVAVFPKAAGSSAVATQPFAAIALDRTAPTAGYTLNRTSGYLVFPGGNFLATPSAAFTLSQTSLSDPSTPITRKVTLGDGSTAKTWTTGTSLVLTYSRAGTYVPHVVVTDSYGNADDVALPAVHVLNDVTAPVVGIRIPAGSNLISSWRVVRGTAVDTGVGVQLAAAVVAQKRAGTWYAYNFHKRTWVKGYAKLGRTLNRKAVPAFMVPTSAGAWHTPRIRGLRRGPFCVEAVALDRAINVSNVAKVARKIH